ncbi:hypothetical protein EDI_187230 [Entamoeba dispar SAW760]|uniref:AB hydrolase-1 domain-containing protein n=1 Tax=Entamoeba dispar (strain ATCC PRA-260 / SAW760) TaxID=370354 RepID=B0ENB8_ENTDS|nr:uncharacterized protein EDI_187230 [Entamoeba dispar SAW760]EDR23995.1 hypothetical protein EDI_187230 [Entamoeba dispar SAW760]|eukprot:EDR23995.1 hypothetical protein EDI_187230 [Entamoeba dispar SAW760]
MSEQYKYLLDHPPKQCNYDESLKGLVMAPFPEGEPIPVRFMLTKINPYNFSLFVFHSSEKDLKDIEDEMVMVSKMFKARIIAFDYPGYGLNKNKKDVSMEKMLDSIFDVMAHKGYREDRTLLLGYSHGCGPALQYASILSERKKAALSLETNGIILFYPVDTIPLGIDYHFQSFFNSVQNVVYYHVLMMVPKHDKFFNSMKEIEKIRKSDENYKSRVEICVHNFSRLKPTSLNRKRLIDIHDSTYPWFKKVDAQITKYKVNKLNISMAITTVLKLNKKIPSLPIHNDFLINQFLNRNRLDELIPIFEEKRLYSTVFVIMNNLENSSLIGEDRSIVDKLNRICRVFKPIITKDWKTLRHDMLCETLTRIDETTDILDKKTKALQSSKKVEVPEGTFNNNEIEMDSESNGGDNISEQTFITLNGKKVLNPKKKTIGGATSNKFVVPQWAKGIECDFTVFVKQPINFSDYFLCKESLHKKHSNTN